MRFKFVDDNNWDVFELYEIEVLDLWDAIIEPNMERLSERGLSCHMVCVYEISYEGIIEIAFSKEEPISSRKELIQALDDYMHIEFFLSGEDSISWFAAGSDYSVMSINTQKDSKINLGAEFKNLCDFSQENKAMLDLAKKD